MQNENYVYFKRVTKYLNYVSFALKGCRIFSLY